MAIGRRLQLHDSEGPQFGVVGGLPACAGGAHCLLDVVEDLGVDLRGEVARLRPLHAGHRLRRHRLRHAGGGLARAVQPGAGGKGGKGGSGVGGRWRAFADAREDVAERGGRRAEGGGW